MSKFFSLFFLCNVLSITGMDCDSGPGCQESSPLFSGCSNGSLNIFDNSFTLKILTNNDFFLITYGIDSGNLEFEKNGTFIDFKNCTRDTQCSCTIGLLATFKVNKVDYNHNTCYREIPNDDTLTHSYKKDRCYYSKHTHGYMEHSIKDCYIEDFKAAYNSGKNIKIPNGMIEALKTL